jgi:hypothetical protein
MIAVINYWDALCVSRDGTEYLEIMQKRNYSVTRQLEKMIKKITPLARECWIRAGSNMVLSHINVQSSDKMIKYHCYHLIYHLAGKLSLKEEYVLWEDPMIG